MTHATLPSFWHEQLVDEAVDAYVEWREESGTVRVAYSRWASAAAEDAERAHAAYQAALDREEVAAQVYASLIERVGELLNAGFELRSGDRIGDPHRSRKLAP
jgi:hypothetical protein